MRRSVGMLLLFPRNKCVVENKFFFFRTHQICVNRMFIYSVLVI